MAHFFFCFPDRAYISAATIAADPMPTATPVLKRCSSFLSGLAAFAALAATVAALSFSLMQFLLLEHPLKPPRATLGSVGHVAVVPRP